MTERTQLVLLAGPSCAGKSSLGIAASEVLGTPWLFWEIDRVGPRLPASAVIQPAQVATLTREELDKAMALQDRLVEASLNAITAYIDQGYGMIAELFLWDERHLRIADRALTRLNPLVVELRCPLDELERREKERGTTYIGTARTQYEGQWRVSPDLVLDSTRSPNDLCQELTAWLSSEPKARWQSDR